ncbi:MAG: hypothetical protein WDO13_01915 [Verrucomicrobiota bacterium]
MSKSAPPPAAALVPRQRWPLLRAELVWAYAGRTQARHSGRWSYVPHSTAWLVLHGEVRMRTPGTTCAAHAGEWLLAPPGERWQETSSDCRILSIAFTWQWLFGRDLFPLPGPVKTPDASPGLRTLGLRLARRGAPALSRRASRAARAGRTAGGAPGAAARFPRLAGGLRGGVRRLGIQPVLMALDPRVEEAVRVFSGPGRAWPRPGELARDLGLSLSQLNRLFQAQFGDDGARLRRTAAAGRGAARPRRARPEREGDGLPARVRLVAAFLSLVPEKIGADAFATARRRARGDLGYRPRPRMRIGITTIGMPCNCSRREMA